MLHIPAKVRSKLTYDIVLNFAIVSKVSIDNLYVYKSKTPREIIKRVILMTEMDERTIRHSNIMDNIRGMP